MGKVHVHIHPSSNTKDEAQAVSSYNRAIDNCKMLPGSMKNVREGTTPPAWLDGQTRRLNELLREVKEAIAWTDDVRKELAKEWD